MRSLILAATLLLYFVPAASQTPAEYETFYDAPTRVNLGGRPVIADIALHADMAAASRGDLIVALTTDVTKFVTETQSDLKNWISSRRQDCGERWDSSEPIIDFPNNQIRFAIEIGIEYWTCGWNGKGNPGLLTRESGFIDVTLIPEIIDGKLQARLGDFSIDNRSGVSRYLPLEFVIRRALNQELKKLNENPKFFRAPEPLFGEEFQYESIEADKSTNGTVVITATFTADGDRDTLDRIADSMAREGVTQ